MGAPIGYGRFCIKFPQSGMKGEGLSSVAQLSAEPLVVFRDRSMIFGMWVHDHKVVCRVP